FLPFNRVVLVGQEKVGKSSSGNTILEKKEFECHLSSVPLNLRSRKAEGVVFGRRVTVVDTPGLFSTQLSARQVKAALRNAVQMSSPGPHVFLLTLQLGRFTMQEQASMEVLRKMLGAKVCERTMVLFTYGDRLEDTDISQLIKEDTNLQEVLRSCSGQFHVFNNKKMEDRRQLAVDWTRSSCRRLLCQLCRKKHTHEAAAFNALRRQRRKFFSCWSACRVNSDLPIKRERFSSESPSQAGFGQRCFRTQYFSSVQLNVTDISAPLDQRSQKKLCHI
uniref:GTPase IMAP family member 8 n=1 Tax=Oryzias latipes TaxID=8090 RepID=A0A3P9KS81_ORYLA